MPSFMLRFAVPAAALLLTALVGCSHHPKAGAQKKEVRDATGFTAVESHGFADVHVAVGESQSINIDCDENLLPYVETHTEDNALVIKTKDVPFRFSFGGDHHCIVNVTLPTLASVSASGSGDVTVEGRGTGLARINSSGSGDMKVDSAAADKIEVHANGSGDTQVGELTADHLIAKLNGSGKLKAKGSAKVVELSSNGSGDVDARDLRTVDSQIRLRGSGDVKISSSGKVDISTLGSGDVTVIGHPTDRHVSSHGSGSVHWKD